eukprot:968967-Lingulodinium_polyedra.AAC.1
MVVYMAVGEGMSARNAEILASIMATVDSTGLPAIIGGDFNMSPKTLWQSGIPKQGNMTIMAPDGATCITGTSATVLDYFMVSMKYTQMVQGVKVQPGFEAPPHRA